MRLIRSLALITVLCGAVASQAQSSQPATGETQNSTAAQPSATQSATTAKTPEAKPEDVKSVDAIVAAVYDVISGPAGTRDWNRFRSLFIPEGRLIPNGVKPNGEWSQRVLSVDDFAKRAGEAVSKEGFFETGISNKVEQYGTIAHVFSTYESRHEKDGKPFARGINSIQLASDGHRWYVVEILWQAETPTTPIPKQYLKQ
jgi:hypothetical protein